jgi:DNA (cytosine-5)-methyltransferase 1
MQDLWAYRKGSPVPVIDLFAGPGGLGEGFSRAGSGMLFKTALSIEMDPHAHSTLTLRALQRLLPEGRRVPDELVDLMLKQITLVDLLKVYPDEGAEAGREAVCIELCKDNKAVVFGLIRKKLKQLGSPGRWVLIGGPPCQAYSLAGRARRSRALSSGEYSKEGDKRHYLYREYLQIIAEFKPAVFVMENVKGLLSSEVGGTRMFDRILDDLQEPGLAFGSTENLEYRLYCFAPREGDLFRQRSAASFVVRSEEFGVPQSRHRVIVLGVRSDISLNENRIALAAARGPNCEAVIGDLPRIRSRLSRGADSATDWASRIKEAGWRDIIDGSWRMSGTLNAPEMRRALNRACGQLLDGGFGPAGAGDDVLFVGKGKTPKALADWYRSESPGVVFNHESRGHMVSDLHRYLFAAVFADSSGYSPTLANFPKHLLPLHRNAERSAATNQLFVDRFRVQTARSIATTVTSHISKDGHAFIHYDPAQCRSLTVREAARIQTFPDDYCFLGPRTSQYHQVGNAVPPYLAFQIAEAIAEATGMNL